MSLIDVPLVYGKLVISCMGHVNSRDANLKCAEMITCKWIPKIVFRHQKEMSEMFYNA